MIDVSTIEYDVELITESGTRYLLNEALISLQWEEQKGELAQKAVLTLANFQIGNTYLISAAKINCVIQIYGKWNEERKVLFDGTIWEWQYVSSTQKELTITAYDRLIRLQQSKDFKYYTGGLTTQAIIGDICAEWGIPLSYNWGQSITHGTVKFDREKLSDMIIKLLEEAYRKTGVKYVMYYKDGRLQITDYGTNNPVYRFDTENTISTIDKLSINNLVTQVIVYGKEDSDDKRPVEGIEDGELLPNGDHKFGLLREIVRRDSNKTLDDAIAEAKTILNSRGKPEETIQVRVPDLPFLRKGDKIELAAGNLIGLFFVEGITHAASVRQMTLSLSRG